MKPPTRPLALGLGLALLPSICLGRTQWTKNISSRPGRHQSEHPDRVPVRVATIFITRGG